jgi:FkbM family methyltransferase
MQFKGLITLLLSFFSISCAAQCDFKFDVKNYEVCFVPEMDAYFYVDNIPDGIKKHLRQGIYWESTIGNLIKMYSSEGSVVVDVGAHIGIHTIAMSRAVGTEGKVIAFEPQKKMYVEQLQNLKLNDCSNVISIRKALGERSKTIELAQRNSENEGGTPIGWGGDEAKMITLDSLELENVSLIKIDVESYEYFVFQGARETILRNKPVIIFEVMGGHDYKKCTEEIKSKFDQVLSLVESFGYRVSLIFGNDYIAFPD